jgi:hypothetical protein
MVIRRIYPIELKRCDEILGKRGILPLDMGHNLHNTWVLEKEDEVVGMFTLRMEHSIPYVVHFSILGESVRNAWELYRGLQEILREMDAPRFIFGALKSNARFEKAIPRFIGAKRYGEDLDHTFYVMEVPNGSFAERTAASAA